MGSSCSSSQSNKDNASVRSEDSGHVESASAPQPSTQPAGVGTKPVQNERPPAREEGTAIGTPLSSSTGPVATGEGVLTKAPLVKQPEAKEPPSVTLPDLSALSSSTRALIMGKFSEVASWKSDSRKICVCLIGDDEDSGAERTYIESRLLQEQYQSCRESQIDLTVLNIEQINNLYETPNHEAQLLQNFIKGEEPISSIINVVFLSETPGSWSLPVAVHKEDFESLLNQAHNSAKNILETSYVINNNFNPPIYTLVNPAKSIHNLKKCNRKERESGILEWKKKKQNLLKIFIKELTEEKKKKYLMPYLYQVIESLANFKYCTTVWVWRTFTSHPEDANIVATEESQVTLLQTLRSTMKALTNDDRVVRVETHWKASEEDEGAYNDHIYSKILSQFEHVTKKLKLDNMEKTNLLQDGIRLKLLREISTHLCYANTTSGNSFEHKEMLHDVKKYLKSDSKSVFVVEGNTSSGKTTSLANICCHCEQWMDDACVIARFGGLTEESSSVEGVMMSIYEQCVCVNGGLHAGVDLNNLLQCLKCIWAKGHQSRPLIIIIDAFDQIKQNSDKDLEDFLPRELPKNVKFIISLKENSKLLDTISKNCIVKVPLFVGDALDNFSSKFCNDSLIRNIASKHTTAVSPLQLILLTNLLLFADFNKLQHFSNLKNHLEVFINFLITTFCEPMVKLVLRCLSTCKSGLTDSELLLIIHSIFNNSDSKKSLNLGSSVLTWLHFRCQMQPLLISRKCSGLITLGINSDALTEIINGLHSGTLTDALKAIARFVMGRVDGCLPTTFNFGECTKVNVTNLRTLQEFCHLCLINGSENLHQSVLFNINWIVAKTKLCGPTQVLEDLSSAMKLECYREETSKLRSLVYNSSKCLDYDYSQIYTQLHERLHKNVPYQDLSSGSLMAILYQGVENPILPCLMALHASNTQEVELSTISDSESLVHIDCLFRLPKHPRHLVAICTSKGVVCVWDVQSLNVVRTLKGIAQPRRLQMIDDYRCLLLCGRELRIYNLDDGSFLMKLREVMNQKMPLFSLHNPEHVVALSRNRMYVNMMNLTKGDCVTTFKVGEDRFLNSLMVSENGKFCVCGDDTQKPSALLVWDLEMRKLLYDLRIPHHEFTTSLAAITREGHYVSCVCREVDDVSPNFLVVYDLQSGTLFKRWEPGVNTVSIAISSVGTCVVVGLTDCSIMAYDLITGNPRWTFQGHTFPPDEVILDAEGVMLVSYNHEGRDPSVRIWDVLTGNPLAVFTPDSRVTACDLNIETSTLVLALEGQPRLCCYLLCLKDQRCNEKLERQKRDSEVASIFGSEENMGKVFDVGQS